MIHMSNDARKVFKYLAKKGITLSPDDVFRMEVQIGSFFPNHIMTVIDQILKKPANIERANESGWDYFEAPVTNILVGRTQSHRADWYEAAEGALATWSPIACSFLVADFNSAEAALLLQHIPTFSASEVQYALTAARAANKRTIYYINGILERERQDRRGKTAEILQKVEESAQRGFKMDESHELMDVGERAAALLHWQETQKMNSIYTGMRKISEA